MKKPFVSLCIIYILGLCFFYNITYNFSLIFLITFVLILLLFSLYKRINAFQILILFLIFMFAGLNIYYKLNDSKLIDFAQMEIEIESIVKKQISNSNYYDKYIIDVTNVSYEDKRYVFKEKALLKVIGKTRNIRVGDRIKVKCIVNEPNRNTNPHLFNYKLYLQNSNIYTIEVTNDYDVEIISHNELTIPQSMSYKFKNRIINILEKTLTKHNSSIMKSIFLGENSYMDSNILDMFRDLGIAHVLAVSGLHIGIITAFLLYAFRKIRLNKKTSVLLTILILWIYGYIIGYPASILRALIMFTCLILSQLTFRRYDSINSLCFGAIILLVYNPLWVFSVGFQLSFGVTLSIIIFTDKINKLFNSKYSAISKAISPILAAQIGTIPIIAYHFNKLPLMAILTNLILIPIISVCIVIGFIMIIFSLLSIKLAFLIGIILNGLLCIFSYLGLKMHDIFNSTVLITSPSYIEIVLYYISILMLFGITKFKVLNYKLKNCVFVYLIVFFVLTNIINLCTDNIEIHFIDVGQGDCTLIKVNNKNILIDGGGAELGNFDVGENIVLPYLLKNKVSSLDAVFVTHYHKDHCDGIISISDKIKIRNLFIGYMNLDNKLYIDLIEKANQNNIHIAVFNKGDELDIGKNFKIKTLHPVTPSCEISNENNMSLVQMIDIFNNKILFTGDIEKEAEMEIITNTNGYVDILKVPHHGSKTSSTQEFINCFKPKYAVISVGENNFGHPDSRVIDRYKSTGTKIFRTDKNGLVKVIFNKTDMCVSYFIKEKPTINDIIFRYRDMILYDIIYIVIGFLLIYYNRVYID